MLWVGIAVAVAVVLSLLFALSLMKVSGDADRALERFRREREDAEAGAE